ncbi:MAG TPA: fatty acid desaturase [Hyphomicrobiaceae bacterium]|nr:fatty acid desaturase [Hyphomicrobiaceae bacterium]
MSNATPLEAPARTGRDWIEALQRYREPDLRRSVFEIAVTAVPFVILWVLAWAALSVGYWLTLLIAVPAAGFLVRLFMIQHDCGHGAFFRSKSANDWVGRCIGVMTLTPYAVWRRCHSVHHATSGNLHQRGMGDITTLTVREYLALPWYRRVAYRLYRNPLVMFGFGPAYLFLLQNRLPFGLMGERQYWISAMGTNAAIAIGVAVMAYLMGLSTFLSVHIPIIVIAASIGVWLFYVQHQFEETFWAKEPEWKQHDAALYGSSHYDLPPAVRWLTANIGVHHVHHLYSRIPYYRLSKVIRDYPELANVRRLTFVESLGCLRLRLWDESGRRLLSFREALATAGR